MVQLRSSRAIDRRVTNRMQGGFFQRTLTVSLLCATLCWYIFGLIQLGLRIEHDATFHNVQWYEMYPNSRHSIDDGRWSIGLYRGESSPLQLQPIDASPWISDDDARLAWPVSNPVFTKQHVEEGSTEDRHGTFVSDPFLFRASKKIASLIGTSRDGNSGENDGINMRDQVQEFLDDPLGMKSSVNDEDEDENGGTSKRKVQATTVGMESSQGDESSKGERKDELERVIQGPMYLFFRTRNLETRQGDIGVAVSNNGGLAWTYLGIALSSKNASFSYPYIFEWNDNVYLLPECKDSGELTLYKAELNNFPFEWVKEKTLLDKPVVNPSIVEWDNLWYLFVTDDMDGEQSFTSSTNDKICLHIYHAETPLGPWMSHFLNPVMVGNEGSGARMAGRLVKQHDKLYRFGQDGQGLYGKDVLAFRVDTLTPTDFVQTRVKFQAGRIRKGTGTWNSERRHHVDITQLPDGSWLGVLDGDYFQDRSEANKEMLLLLKYYPISLLGIAIVIRMALRSSKYKIISMYLWSLFSRIVRPKSLGQQLQSIFIGIVLSGSALLALSTAASWRCQKQYYESIIDTSNITHEIRIPIEGAYSKFTIIVDSVGSKASLKMKKRKKVLTSIIKHYSSCPSTSEVIFSHSRDDSSMMEYLEKNFSPMYRPWVRHTGEDKLYDVGDLSISTRAAVLISRGMMVSCKDLENIFSMWRRDPHALFGSKTFRYEKGQSPGTSDYFNALSSGLYFLDFDRLTELKRNDSLSDLKSVAGEYNACDDVLLSLSWERSCTLPDPLRHFQPTRSVDLLPVSKNEAHIDLKSKNECFEKMIEQDHSVLEDRRVYQVDLNPKMPMCRGLIFTSL